MSVAISGPLFCFGLGEFKPDQVPVVWAEVLPADCPTSHGFQSGPVFGGHGSLAVTPEADGLDMAVASGSEEHIVRGCLAANGLLDLFPIIITPRKVARGKPAPDMFLLAAEQMGLAAADCLVLEDGQSGVDAAIAAGMQWVFVPRTMR